jgi:hypothetical protein
MRNRNAVVSGMALFAVAITGACVDSPPTEPRAGADVPSIFGSPVANRASHDGTLDAVFARIAGVVPGFGGYFYDDARVLNIYLHPGMQTMATPAALQALRGHLEGMGVSAADLQGARVLEAQYDFAQLAAMHRQVSPVLGLEGVVYTDADEAVNRVAVGVTNPTAAAAVERAIAMLGVPREAVVIRETAPIHLMQSLRDYTRPVAGGLQINFPSHLCTMGFNVRSVDRPQVQGFVGASHCSAVWGGVAFTPYYQPLGTMPNSRLGIEVHDPPFFTGAPCPVGRRCRWSDTNGVRYDQGVNIAFGSIYRTADLFSVTIDPNNRMFNIVAELQFPFVGDTVHKVGRTSGWTTGVVSGTCVDTNVQGVIYDQTFLCQEHVSSNPGHVLPGDSGSPVFHPFPAGQLQNVRLNGLLWGATVEGNLWAFSAMSEIRFEHSPPQGWITFPGQTPPSAR